MLVFDSNFQGFDVFHIFLTCDTVVHTLPAIVEVCNMAKATLHMKIEADLKVRLRQLAEQENRSLSNLVEKVLKDYAEQHKNRYPSPH